MMEVMFGKVIDWIWTIIAAILWVFWNRQSATQKELAATREQMVARGEFDRVNEARNNEIKVVAQLLAATRETHMTREEMVGALRDIKADTNDRLDHIVKQIENAHDKLTESEAKTATFRHSMRNDLNQMNLNLARVAIKNGIDLIDRAGNG